jgi:hypothetical protein
MMMRGCLATASHDLLIPRLQMVAQTLSVARSPGGGAQTPFIAH